MNRISLAMHFYVLMFGEAITSPRGPTGGARVVYIYGVYVCTFFEKNRHVYWPVMHVHNTTPSSF